MCSLYILSRVCQWLSLWPCLNSSAASTQGQIEVPQNQKKEYSHINPAVSLHNSDKNEIMWQKGQYNNTPNL